jgi:hypothetical protein
MRFGWATSARPRTTATMAAVAIAAVLAACGSSGGSAAPKPAGGSGSTDSSSASGNTASGQGRGTATLTVGDETWEFDTVMCAFGTDETKNKDWDFSLSAIQDGLQLSVSGGAPGGQYGDSISLNDIQDFENPSVAWEGPFVSVGTGQQTPSDVLEIDGKSVTASVDFADSRSDAAAPNVGVAGTLDATCP